MATRLFSSVILLLILMIAQTSMAQETSDSISVINPARGRFEYKNATIDLKELLHLTQKNPEAYNQINKAIKQRNGGIITGAIGGGLIGFTLGSAVGSGEPMWWLAGVGAGFFGIASVLSSESNKKVYRGVAIYNAGLNDPKTPGKSPVILGMTSTGLGISWRF